MNAPTEPAFALTRQQEVVAALREFLPASAVLYETEDVRPYECDGLSAFRELPMVVALPDLSMVLRVNRMLEVGFTATLTTTS